MARPRSAAATTTSNISMKEGVVVDVIYPDDARNLSKTSIEYNVVVLEYSQKQGTNIVQYKNCTTYDLFGTANNYLNYTLQPSSTDLNTLTNNNSPSAFKDGARVLLLCVGGLSMAGAAVIVGGRNNITSPKYSSSDGQFYDFNFNGINYNVNNDGELTITFNSPSTQAGVQSNAAAAGTQIKIDKQGHFTVLDNKGQKISIDRDAQQISIGNGSESVVVDKGAKSITLKSGGDETFNAGGKLDVTSGADMSISSGGALNVKSSGATNVNSGGAMQTQVSGQWQLQAQGNVQITALGEVTIIGAAGPVIASQGPLTMVGLGDVPVATVGTSTVIGVGNLGLPVVSNIITGSFTVFVGT